MLKTVENWHVTSYINVTIHFHLQPYCSLFCSSSAIICEHAWSAHFKTKLLWYLSNGIVTVICDHAGWSLTRRGRYDRVNCTRFSKKKFIPFLFNQRPFKSNCTVRVGAILNNETDLTLTIDLQNKGFISTIWLFMAWIMLKIPFWMALEGHAVFVAKIQES